MSKQPKVSNSNNRRQGNTGDAGGASKSTTQQHLTRESGRIRQRETEQQNNNQRYNNNNNNNFSHQQQHVEEVPPQTAEEKFAGNVNLLVLNLNANPEQIYRHTIGKMLHSILTPFHQKFKIGGDKSVENKDETELHAEKEEGSDEAVDKKSGAAASAAAKNKPKGPTKQTQQKHNEMLNVHDNNSLSTAKSAFFPEDQQTATMLIHFPDKFSAKKLAQRLNQGQLFSATGGGGNNNNNNNSNAAGSGASQVHASVVPTATLKPRYEPCALRITELSAASSNNENNNKNNNNDDASTSFTLTQLQQYLSSNPGFLSVTKVARVASGSKKNSNNNNRNQCFVATYADSGAALQARALMSGRAFHGVHLLLELIEEEDEQIVPLV